MVEPTPSQQISRYVRWTNPDCAPPLPLKEGDSIDTAREAGPAETALPSVRETLVRPVRSYSFGGSTQGFPSRGNRGVAAIVEIPTEPRFIFGDSQGTAGSGDLRADSKIVEEAIANPSNWLLRNRHTGQEVEAKSFVQSLVHHTVRRPPQHAGPLATWMARRYRNNGHVAGARPRPTLLSHSNGAFTPNDNPRGAPLSPPSRPLPSRAISKSPACRRGKSSLLTYSAQPLGNSFITRSNSSTSSAAVVSSDVDVFRLSNMSSGQILPRLHPGGIRAISFSPSGKFLATAGADHRCFVFRVRGRLGRERKVLEEESATGETSVAAEVDGLPEGEQDGASLGRLVEDNPVRVLHGHVGEIVCVSWSPDDRDLLTASADGTVRCWHPLDGDKCTRTFEHGGRVTAVAWDPSSTPNAIVPEGEAGEAGAGRRFLSGCMDAKLRLFSVDDPEPEESVLVEKPVTAVSFAPDGKTFVAGSVGGGVGFYRTEGLVQFASTECRRHGIRHTAAQHALQVASPVRRLSSSTGSPTTGIAATGRATSRERRRRGTMAGAASRGSPVGVEERVTGLCFRPQRKGLSELTNDWSFKPERDDDNHSRSGSGDALCGQIGRPAGLTADNNPEDSPEARAPCAGANGGKPAAEAVGNGGGPHAWTAADVLVSTNDSRTRVLVAGGGGAVTVGAKLKGHNTDGILGRHAMARFSEDGELVISGSTDGSVHVWPTPDSDSGSKSSSRRGPARPSWREGHNRAQVCDKSVAVPVALFAPDAVAKSIGGESSRVVVTGDDDGSLKVFVC
ncbi:unnamed protein product [Ascophyllum nodosum]